MKKYNRVSVFLSILILVGVLGAAFYLPGAVSRIYDNHTLEKVYARKLALSTYQVSYGSFEEKLHAMGRAMAEGGQFNVINRNTAVELPEEGEVSKQSIKREAERLFREELQLNMDLSAYVLAEQKKVSVLCINVNGEEILTENSIYVLSYICPDKASKQELKDTIVYNAGPHITLWVDEEFGKIYGFTAAGMAMNGLGMNLTIWENSHMDAITNYWGLGESFALGEIEEILLETYQQETECYVWGEERVWVGQDAYLPIDREVVREEENIYLRLGLQPFIYSFQEVELITNID